MKSNYPITVFPPLPGNKWNSSAFYPKEIDFVCVSIEMTLFLYLNRISKSLLCNFHNSDMTNMDEL